MNLYVWSALPPRELRVSFFSVGEGDAALIESPSGARVLIDGGPSSGAVLRSIGQTLPFFVRSLDAAIETTPSASYAAGFIGVFARYHVGQFFVPPFSGDTKTADTISHAATDVRAKTVTLSRGMRILLGGGAYIDVLSPFANTEHLDANSGALVLRLVYGNASFLFSSGALQKTELALVSTGTSLKSDVLKAGGHGSKSASAAAFAAAVAPRSVIFSRGCNNSYGHPATTTVQVFRALGAALYDTCENGTVTFVSDGSMLGAMRL